MLYFLPNGKELELRPAAQGDEPALLAFFKQLSSETEFMSLYPEETDDFVPDFFATYLHQPQHLLLLGLIDNHLIGAVSIKQQSFYKNAHIGVLAIGILHSCWNLGIGRRMMTTATRWAGIHKQLEMIELSVSANNEKAIQLYRNFGFLEYGRMPNAIRLKDGEYVDTVCMFNRIK